VISSRQAVCIFAKKFISEDQPGSNRKWLDRDPGYCEPQHDREHILNRHPREMWVQLKDYAGVSNSSVSFQIDSQITSVVIQNGNCGWILDKRAKFIVAMSQAPMHPEKTLPNGHKFDAKYYIII
jgi:hypothetical protein